MIGYHLLASVEPGEVRLWDSEYYIEESAAPSLAKMPAEHMNGSGLLGEATTALVSLEVKHDLDNLY